jgi:hypothetical protein
MNRRFTLDRRSFEQFLAALSLVQQLKRQAAYQRAPRDPDQPFISLLQLQRAINAGTVDLPFVLAGVVKLTRSVAGANAAGIWLFRNADEFSCCAQIGSIQDPDRLGVDILAQLADSNHLDSNSCAFSPTLRKASHYPGSPNSVAIAALRVNEKMVGALAAFSSDFDAFASRDLDNLHFLAGLLEQALQKAMQAGYREAVALENAALLNLLERIAPHVKEFERQLSPSNLGPVRDPAHASSASTSIDRVVYGRLQQPTAFPTHPAEPAEIWASRGEPSAADLSVPGVGVRAALGDVREFTGDEKPFFLWEAVRSGRARAHGLAAKCRSGALRVVAETTTHIRIAGAHMARVPRGLVERGRSLSFAPFRPIATQAQNQFAQIKQWRLKVRILRLPRLRPSNWLHLSSPWPGSAPSRSKLQLQLLWGSLAGKLRTRLNHGRDRFSYFLRLSKIQARSLRRELRQKRANLSAVVAHERMRARVAQRRQKSMLTNSAEITGEALQRAGESLADVASSAGHSTITAFSVLKGRVAPLKRPQMNARNLRRTAGAIGVLAVMAIFLALQVSVHHSLEHVDAASASSVTTATPSLPAVLADATVQPKPKPGPSSHLQITDASVADTLHDLTRYEIVTLQRAAEYGDDEAAFQLGMAYETGYYVRQNCSKAAHWVKIAAEAGSAAAAYNLGLRYRDGDGLQADESAAGHWLSVASAQRYSAAKLTLAAVR